MEHDFLQVGTLLALVRVVTEFCVRVYLFLILLFCVCDSPVQKQLLH